MKSKGITLIALVITIIVLLILAGVTIALLTGDNGILKQAQNAKDVTERKSVEEEILIEWADIQAEAKIKDMEISQMGEMLEDILQEKDPDAAVIYDKNNQKLSITYKEMQLEIAVNDKNFNPNINQGVMEELRVGDYIDYTPQEQINSYTLSSTYSGYSDQTKSKENLKWRVLNINEDGMIDLISTAPTRDMIYFGGANGFNNGVYLLNELSKTLYSNSDKKATARSLNLEDIQNKMDLSVYDYHNHVDVAKYGTTVSYSSNKQYPVQWKNDNGIEGQSESRSLIPSTETISETETNGDLIVTQAFWSYSNLSGSNFKKVKTSTNEEDSNIYHTLLTLSSNNSAYWLASRFAYTNNPVLFGIHRSGRSDVNYSYLFDSRGISYNEGSYLRPIVSIPSTQIDISTGNGLSTDTPYGIK